MVLGPPKSRAGVRTVNIPRSLVPDLHFNKVTRWVHVVALLGVLGLHFHDLRHTGNMLAAATGATTKDLMRRMGQDSERAALLYQHATNKADQVSPEASTPCSKHSATSRKTTGPAWWCRSA